MRFLLRFANRMNATPADSKRLTKLAYETVQQTGADIGNLRVSRTAIELDLLLGANINPELAVKALEAKLGPILTERRLDVPEPPRPKTEAISSGLALFNEERYWESHEAWEVAWKASSGEEKEVLQGLILAAAALVHLQKDEREVTLSIMRRAHEKLAPYGGVRFSIDLDGLKTNIAEQLQSNQPFFFKIGADP